MNPLPAVENNLRALQELLQDPTLWGLPEQNCAVISNPQTSAEVLEPVRSAVAAAEDTLLVYFAGHGLLDTAGNEFYLTLPGSDKERMWTWMRFEFLRYELLDSRARHKILVLDCCYSGHALDFMGDEDGSEILADTAATSGIYVMAAADKRAKVNGHYSAFSGELISLIRDGIPEEPKLLTVDSLFETVKVALRDKKLPIPQKRDRDFGARLALFRNKAFAEPTKEHYGSVESEKSFPLFESRRQLHDAGIHRPLQAGICGTAERGGAESIVVSGGYRDDRDYGNVIIYTGHGGRDGNTGRQIKDQSPRDTGNAALIRNIMTGLPVRVIRGSGGNPEFSPDFGYSYDGLFKVTDYWTKRGADGYIVLQYRLEKLVDGVPQKNISQPDPGRWQHVSAGVYADIALADNLKRLYDYTCQVCETVLAAPGGLRFACAVHIKGLGLPHEGPDAIDNMLCLCANHRDLFNYGSIVIDDMLHVVDQITGEPLGPLTVRHEIGAAYLRYHREHYSLSSHSANAG